MLHGKYRSSRTPIYFNEEHIAFLALNSFGAITAPTQRPKNLRTFRGHLPQTHSSAAIVSEFKILLGILSHSSSLQSLYIRFPKRTQEPVSQDFSSFDWVDAFRALTMRSASTLIRLHIENFPTLSNFGTDTGLAVSQFCGSTLTNLRHLHISASFDRTLDNVDVLNDFTRYLGTLTSLEHLAVMMPRIRVSGADYNALENLKSLQYLLLPHGTSQPDGKDAFMSMLDRKHLFNEGLHYSTRHLLVVAVDNLPTESLITFMDRFAADDRTLGKAAWDIVFADVNPANVRAALAHHWCGPQILRELKYGSPPASLSLLIQDDEKLLTEILDAVLAASDRPKNPKAFYQILPSAVDTLEKIVQGCIRRGRFKCLKLVLLRVPFLHLLRPRLIKAILESRHVFTIDRICTSSHFPQVFKRLLNASTRELDGVGLCTSAYFWKLPNEKDSISIIKCLIAAGAPIQHVEMDSVPVGIVPLLLESPGYEPHEKHATPHVIKALVASNAKPELVCGLAKFLSRDRLVHILGGYPHKLQVLEAAKKKTG